MKFLPTKAELFHAVCQQDMTKLIVAFRSFVNAPKNGNVRTQLSPSAGRSAG